MELTLVGLQYSGKTTFVNVIAVSKQWDYKVAKLKIDHLTLRLSAARLSNTSTHRAPRIGIMCISNQHIHPTTQCALVMPVFCRCYCLRGVFRGTFIALLLFADNFVEFVLLLCDTVVHKTH